MKYLLITLISLTSYNVFATGGMDCFSSNKKINFSIVESSDQAPVSVKLYYMTDSVAGEDGSYQSYDLKNTPSNKYVQYFDFKSKRVVTIVSDESMVVATINKSTWTGSARIAIAGEEKNLKVTCVKE